MTTIPTVFRDFAKNFPRTLGQSCFNVINPTIGVVSVLLARACNVIPISGGSALFIANTLIYASNEQLVKSYTETGGNDPLVIKAIRVQSLVQHLILPRLAAFALGNPISLIRYFQFSVIFIGVTIGLIAVAEAADRVIGQS